MRSRLEPAAVIVACGVSLAALSATKRGVAQPASTPARVRVEAPADCASVTSFWSAVARHTTRLRPGSGDGSAAIDVILRRGEGRVLGELRVARPNEVAWERQLSGATCDEVTDGLGLVAALAFDSTTPPASAGPASLPVLASVGAPAREERAPPPAVVTAWQAGIGVSAGTLALGASGVTLAYGGFLEIERERSGLSPSFRVGLAHAEANASDDAIRAALAWTIGRASVCPVRADLANALSVRPCVGLDAGVVSASPRGLERARDSRRPWVAPVLAGHARWLPSRAFFVELELALAFPLVRDEFAADPSRSIYRAPALVPMASLAVGVRFP